MSRRSRLTRTSWSPNRSDRDVVARAVDRLDRLPALDRELDGQPLDRLGGEFLGAERIGEFDDVAIALAKLRVSHRHLAVGPGRDRKDARAVQPAAHVFQQGGVALRSGRSPRRSAGPRPSASSRPGSSRPSTISTKFWMAPSSGSGNRNSASSWNEPGLWKVCETCTSATWSRTLAVDAHFADLVRLGDRDRGRPSTMIPCDQADGISCVVTTIAATKAIARPRMLLIVVPPHLPCHADARRSTRSVQSPRSLSEFPTVRPVGCKQALDASTIPTASNAPAFKSPPLLRRTTSPFLSAKFAKMILTVSVSRR